MFADGEWQSMDSQVVEADDVQAQQVEDVVRCKKGRRVEYCRADGRVNANYCRMQNCLRRRRTSALKDLPLCACAIPCFERVVYERVVCE